MASNGGGIGGISGNGLRSSLRSERQGVHHHIPLSPAHNSSSAFSIAASKSVGHGQSLSSSVRNKASTASRRSLTPNSRSLSFDGDEGLDFCYFLSHCVLVSLLARFGCLSCCSVSKLLFGSICVRCCVAFGIC